MTSIQTSIFDMVGSRPQVRYSTLSSAEKVRFLLRLWRIYKNPEIFYKRINYLSL